MLEIELITTKKKLTLSIVKQMPQLPRHVTALRRCKVLGYVKHPSLHKQVNVALLVYNEEYYTLTLRNWKASVAPIKAYANSGLKATVSTQFSNQQHRDEWLELFGLIKTKALATHIYL